MGEARPTVWSIRTAAEKLHPKHSYSYKQWIHWTRHSSARKDVKKNKFTAERCGRLRSMISSIRFRTSFQGQPKTWRIQAAAENLLCSVKQITQVLGGTARSTSDAGCRHRSVVRPSVCVSVRRIHSAMATGHNETPLDRDTHAAPQ